MIHEVGPMRLQPGPDRYCPDCGRLLLHIHEDGSFDHEIEMWLRVEPGGHDEDGNPVGMAMEAVCVRCNPDQNPMTQLPEEVKRSLAAALGLVQDTPLDPRIRAPWENN